MTDLVHGRAEVAAPAGAEAVQHVQPADVVGGHQRYAHGRLEGAESDVLQPQPAPIEGSEIALRSRPCKSWTLSCVEVPNCPSTLHLTRDNAQGRDFRLPLRDLRPPRPIRKYRCTTFEASNQRFSALFLVPYNPYGKEALKRKTIEVPTWRGSAPRTRPGTSACPRLPAPCTPTGPASPQRSWPAAPGATHRVPSQTRQTGRSHNMVFEICAKIVLYFTQNHHSAEGWVR